VSSASPPVPYRRGLAFLAGMGFAVLPAIGPFVALLALISSRIELRRSDRWWWIAALLVALPYGMRGFVTEGALDLLQVLAVWLIYRSAALLRQSQGAGTAAFDVGAGLVAGLAVALVVGLQQVIDVRSETALTLLDGVVWQAHPALFAHSMLVLSALLGIVVPSARLRATALGLGAVAAVLAGSREALFAWLLVAIGLRLFSRRGDHVTRAVEWSTIVVVLVIASGVGGLLGLGRPGFLVDVAGNVRSPNLFRGTEAADGDWWHPLQARFTAQPLRVAGETRTAFTVTKTGFDPWARLQQVVTLWPGETYTLSAALFATDGQRPGLDGWGAAGRANPPSILMTTVDRGRLGGSASGAIELLETAYEPLGGGWSRATVRFRYGGEAPLVWYSGVVVDRVAGVGAQVTFAELQLTAGASDALTAAYVPGDVGRGVMDLRTSRFPIWRDALTAIEARPSLGWGPGGLPGAVHAELPDDVRVRPVAAHAHNLVLTTWVERGLLGALGVLLLLGLLSLRAVQQRDRPALVVILGVIVLNVFDASLMSGGVIYPLAAVLGWRATGHRSATSETGVGSAAGVRISLALADVVAAAAAVSLALALGANGPDATRHWSPALIYTLLAWPAFAGVAGLYPGYGLPRAEELARVVRAAAAAGVAFVVLTQLLGGAFAVPLIAALLTIPFALLLAPGARWLAKTLLRAAMVWGRPVVILGADDLAVQVSRYLGDNPGIGLQPVALFGRNREPESNGTPRLGDIEDAWEYLDREDIRHVIVTPDAAVLGYDEVLRRADKRLRYVQFLPELHGLPAIPVVVAPLGVRLGLEVRNQLASGTNRAAKRSLDVLGASLLLIVLAPVLLALAAWIRFDSPGPALYLSPRLGRYGSRFGCVKFRTMHVDADERLEQLLHADSNVRDEYEHFHKLEDDPRVTRAGAVLRRLSLDELPQLLNVLVGHMSLVGPRPYLVRELDVLGLERDLIFLARPGMTGYWQVDGRNDVSFAQRQAMEADYVRNWSVWWDIELMLRTPAVVLRRTGK
jgi:Undecaprenyl-phosphate galactose phosphotransferase WbaP